MGNDVSQLEEGCPVQVTADAARLERKIRECEDLEWDADMYGGCVGRRGRVTGVDEDGTVSCLLDGVEDECCFPRSVLEDLRGDDDEPSAAAAAAAAPAAASPMSGDDGGVDATPLITPAAAVSPQSSHSVKGLRSAMSRAAQRVKLADAKRHRRLASDDGSSDDGAARSGGGGAASSTCLCCSKLLCLSAAAATSGFVVGYDTAAVAGAMPTVYSALRMRNTTRLVVLLSAPVVAALTASVCGKLASLSRRGALLVSAVLTLFAAVMAAGAKFIGTLLIARLLYGVAAALGTVSAPLYIAEAAPSARRGGLVSSMAVAAVLGQLAAVATRSLFLSADGGWRLVLGFTAVPALCQFVALIWLPESPLVAAVSGKPGAAERVLEALQPGCDAPALAAEMQESAMRRRAQSTRLLIRRHPHAAAVGCGAQVLQQLTFVAAVMYAATPFIARTVASDDVLDAADGMCSPDGAAVGTTQALVAAGLSLLGTAVGAGTVDRVGRKPLLLVSLVGGAATFGLQAVGYIVGSDVVVSAGRYALLLTYAPGLGCVPWVYNAEVFPAELREAGSALATAAHWSSAAAAPALHLALCVLGSAGLCVVCAGVSAVGAVLVGRMVPETGGRALEDVCDLFEPAGVRASLAPIGQSEAEGEQQGPPPPPLAPERSAQLLSHLSAADRELDAVAGDDKDDDDSRYSATV
eukprot:TRINITY_DN3383_c2_g1_i1.p1 TRINITY_DN3383_c2_g1~~TRINITY_DN3383_c2_g1_i1.p1  ORF type:complete len:695 (+),score=286.06 TRINITY_DN3383_c2_g1_i1:55-2139(+)